MSPNPWSTVDAPAISHGDDAEFIQRAAVVQIVANLEAQIEFQELQWVQRDQDFARAMGRAYRRTVIARVPKTSVYTGARPSLVESRFDLWPAVTVRCDAGDPSSDSEQPDQYDSFDMQLVVEALAVAGPFAEVVADRDPDDEIDRQYQRLSAAVHSCIRVDPTLGGVVMPIKLPPRTRSSLPMARPTTDGAGQKMLFQGKEMTYTVTKLAY